MGATFMVKQYACLSIVRETRGTCKIPAWLRRAIFLAGKYLESGKFFKVSSLSFLKRNRCWPCSRNQNDTSQEGCAEGPSATAEGNSI
jgi:hypothetical protein